MESTSSQHPGPGPLLTTGRGASTPVRAGFGLLMGAGLLALSSCASHREPGAHWNRAEVRTPSWTALHGVAGPMSPQEGDGDYGYCVERLRGSVQGHIEVRTERSAAEASLSAENQAYLAANRNGGLTGIAARSFCSVMHSFGQLLGAN